MRGAGSRHPLLRDTSADDADAPTGA
jgi:hypothetical protein